MKVKLFDVCDKASSNLAQKDLKNLSGDYPVYGASGFIKKINIFHRDLAYVAVVKDGAGVGRTMFLPPKSSIIGTLQYLLPKKNIEPKYLYYAVQHLHLEKYYTGATIPHIYFRDYGKELINLPKQSQQIEIVQRFECLGKAICTRKAQMLSLDAIIKSRFVEMFGDPVLNERKWRTNTLKNKTTKIGSGATPRGGKGSYKNKGISLIRSMNVYDGRFEYKDLAHLNNEQAKQLDNVEVLVNDVLFNITGASIARTCIVPIDVLPARVNQHVSIIRCNNELDPIFVNMQFLHKSFKNILLGIGERGGATRQAITKQQLENLMIIVPPLGLQTQFAEFVQQVDKLKAVVQKSLDETQMLFDALMQEYFG